MIPTAATTNRGSHHRRSPPPAQQRMMHAQHPHPTNGHITAGIGSLDDEVRTWEGAASAEADRLAVCECYVDLIEGNLSRLLAALEAAAPQLTAAAAKNSTLRELLHDRIANVVVDHQPNVDTGCVPAGGVAAVANTSHDGLGALHSDPDVTSRFLELYEEADGRHDELRDRLAARAMDATVAPHLLQTALVCLSTVSQSLQPTAAAAARESAPPSAGIPLLAVPDWSATQHVQIAAALVDAALFACDVVFTRRSLRPLLRNLHVELLNLAEDSPAAAVSRTCRAVARRLAKAANL